jgi:hypothetical protein
VVSLRGDAEKGGLVRALRLPSDLKAGAENDAAIKADNNVEEEVATDANGEYTLSKLQPGVEYLIVVKTLANSAPETAAAAASAADDATTAPSSRLARATPAWHRVSLSSASSSVSSLDFVSFRRPAKLPLSGEIVGLGVSGIKHLSSLEVTVALASNPGTVLAKVAPLSSTLPFFEFPSLASSEKYVVTVKSNLPSRTYAFSSAPVVVQLQAQPAHVQVLVEISFKAGSVVEMQGNALWNGLLIVGALLAVWHRDKSTALLHATMRSVQTGNVAPLRSQLASLLPSGGKSTSSSSAAAASFEDSSSSSGGATSSKNKRQKYPSKKEKTHVSTFVRYDSLPVSAEAAAAAAAAQAEKERKEAAAAVERVHFVEQARVHIPARTVPLSKPAAVAKPAAPAAAVAAPKPAPAVVAAKPVPAPAPVVRQASPVRPAPAAAAAPKAKAAPAPVTVSPPAAAASPATVAAAAAAPVAAAPAAAGGASSSRAAPPRFCPSCGEKVQVAHARFCAGCGEKFF